ncbi:MAG: NAD(P)-dependent oxidoreductase [Clostridia bacterium]|nr:NAD(P)-dependent oxidoreductase [Clostridia bacterium]
MEYYIELKDKRNKYVFNALQNSGLSIKEFVFQNCSKDDIIIFSPARKFSVEEANKFSNDITIFAGNLSDEIKNIFGTKNIKLVNMIKDEQFVVDNAKLTAEGVLAHIISDTEKSIFENKILVLGFGRCGKEILNLLNKLGLDVSMVTFNKKKLAIIKNKMYLEYEFFKDLKDFDIVINTIPTKIIGDEMLNYFNNNAIVLEIASVNCLNKELLASKSFNYILCPALPMVFSAESAGKIMFESIKRTLEI